MSHPREAGVYSKRAPKTKGRADGKSGEFLRGTPGYPPPDRIHFPTLGRIVTPASCMEANCGAATVARDDTGFAMTQALKREQSTFDRLLPSLLSEEGRFALLKDEALAGTYDSYADALAEGYRQFGLSGFMVREIRQTPVIVHFSRGI